MLFVIYSVSHCLPFTAMRIQISDRFHEVLNSSKIGYKMRMRGQIEVKVGNIIFIVVPIIYCYCLASLINCTVVLVWGRCVITKIMGLSVALLFVKAWNWHCLALRPVHAWLSLEAVEIYKTITSILNWIWNPSMSSSRENETDTITRPVDNFAVHAEN